MTLYRLVDNPYDSKLVNWSHSRLHEVTIDQDLEYDMEDTTLEMEIQISLAINTMRHMIGDKKFLWMMQQVVNMWGETND